MKTGLVVEGGGMKCAYSAGILDRFLDEHITFDYCIGVSAGSAKPASRPNGIIDTPFIIFISRLLLSDILKLSFIIAKQTGTVIKTFLSAK